MSPVADVASTAAILLGAMRERGVRTASVPRSALHATDDAADGVGGVARATRRGAREPRSARARTATACRANHPSRASLGRRTRRREPWATRTPLGTSTAPRRRARSVAARDEREGIGCGQAGGDAGGGGGVCRTSERTSSNSARFEKPKPRAIRRASTKPRTGRFFARRGAAASAALPPPAGEAAARGSGRREAVSSGRGANPELRPRPETTRTSESAPSSRITRSWQSSEAKPAVLRDIQLYNCI